MRGAGANQKGSQSYDGCISATVMDLRTYGHQYSCGAGANQKGDQSNDGCISATVMSCSLSHEDARAPVLTWRRSQSDRGPVLRRLYIRSCH